VILFHAGFTLFAGGYVGVDVLFVISERDPDRAQMDFLRSGSAAEK
jgi:hypothetical protein